ncbi:hypothetical protein HDU90_002317 [Geranomyces variabilis]|nr:hypothetical protein HDU90_002317 [Geranomyces variabilis]
MSLFNPDLQKIVLFGDRMQLGPSLATEHPESRPSSWNPLAKGFDTKALSRLTLIENHRVPEFTMKFMRELLPAAEHSRPLDRLRLHWEKRHPQPLDTVAPLPWQQLSKAWATGGAVVYVQGSRKDREALHGHHLQIYVTGMESLRWTDEFVPNIHVYRRLVINPLTTRQELAQWYAFSRPQAKLTDDEMFGKYCKHGGILRCHMAAKVLTTQSDRWTLTAISLGEISKRIARWNHEIKAQFELAEVVELGNQCQLRLILDSSTHGITGVTFATPAQYHLIDRMTGDVLTPRIRSFLRDTSGESGQQLIKLVIDQWALSRHTLQNVPPPLQY